MDKYYEQLTSPYKTRLHSLFSALSIAMGIICFLGFIVFWPIALVAGSLAVLFYFLKKNEYVEYEYIFISGDIKIDAIVEARKRKRLIDFDINDAEILAPRGSIYLEDMPSGKRITAFTKNTRQKVFIAVVRTKGRVFHIYFTPDEKFIDLCFRSNPRGVKKSDNV